ncbi:MAG: LLM class flavin-dependent oxidoreductase [Candidatus Limnocylindria bacterium]
MAAAVAAATSRVKVGTWVMSALHRNPALTAKAIETLDEISGGRFVFGLGSGHAGRQACAFGLPEDHVIGRFEEARNSKGPTTRLASWSTDHSDHAPAGSR